MRLMESVTSGRKMFGGKYKGGLAPLYSRKIKKLREKRQLTQKQLADVLAKTIKTDQFLCLRDEIGVVSFGSNIN